LVSFGRPTCSKDFDEVCGLAENKSENGLPLNGKGATPFCHSMAETDKFGFDLAATAFGQKSIA